MNTETMGEKVENIRTRTAETLESAADTMRETAATINSAAKQTGRKLDTSASFVRSCTTGKMFTPLSNAIRKKPFQSLAIATALGLICGFTCRR